MAAFILVLKDTKYSLLARSTNCIYSIVLRHGNFWPKHKHNWCLMPFIKTRHWLYLLWLIWYKQENQQEYAMLLYWVFPLTYMHCICFFSVRGQAEPALWEVRWAFRGGTKWQEFMFKEWRNVTAFFWHYQDGMWDWLCKTEPMEEVCTGKAQVVLSSGLFSVIDWMWRTEAVMFITNFTLIWVHSGFSSDCIFCLPINARDSGIFDKHWTEAVWDLHFVQIC